MEDVDAIARSDVGLRTVNLGRRKLVARSDGAHYRFNQREEMRLRSDFVHHTPRGWSAKTRIFSC
jgi:hypothetical protein